MISPEKKTVQQRVKQLFDYLEEFVQLSTKPVVQIREHHWALDLARLPSHPTIALRFEGREISDGSSGEGGPIKPSLLTVRRPNSTRCPSPPEILDDWLKRGWQEVTAAVQIIETRNELRDDDETVTVAFEEDEERVHALSSWTKDRDAWAIAEKPVREALAVYEKLYELSGILSREREKYELVLGDGLLVWRREEGGIYHPLVEVAVQLEFDPDGPAFHVQMGEAAPVLVTGLFSRAPDVDGEFLAVQKEKVRDEFIDPTTVEFAPFLKQFVTEVHAQGRVEEGEFDGRETDSPRVFRNPWLYLRETSAHYGDAIAAIKRDIDGGQNPPSAALSSLVGVNPGEGGGEFGLREMKPDDGTGSDLFLTLPANDEQKKILRALKSTGAVLVQGPPGTGKTHTIGNIIGHLLALGQRVLVTSHTTKSLKVVRDKVAEPLRHLCLTILEGDRDALAELKASVGHIVRRMATDDSSRLRREAEELQKQREKHLLQLNEARTFLLKAVRAQHEHITTWRGSVSPVDAARYVAERRHRDSWLRDEIDPQQPPPLSEAEFIELYELNSELDRSDQEQLEGDLPDLSELPKVSEFEAGLRVLADVGEVEPEEKRLACGLDDESVEELMSNLEAAGRALSEMENWRRKVVDVGLRGRGQRAPWKQLFALIDEAVELVDDAEGQALIHEPEYDETIDIDEALTVLEKELERSRGGGALGKIFSRLSGPRQRILRSVSVKGRAPRRPLEFKALILQLRLVKARGELRDAWRKVVGGVGGPSVDDLGEKPEQMAQHFAGRIRNALHWSETTWAALLERVETTGMSWVDLCQDVRVEAGPTFEVDLVGAAISREILPALRLESDRRRRDRVAKRFSEVAASLRSWDEQIETNLGRQISDAWRTKDVSAYRSARTELGRVEQLRARSSRRRRLIDRLRESCPIWARALDERKGAHGEARPPGSCHDAWYWRGLDQAIREREAIDQIEIQRRIDELDKRVRSATTLIVEKRAWANQKDNVTRAENTALQGWLKTVQKIGKGTGKRVPALMREARKNLSAAQGAVPVWVMPLSRVAKEVDPTKTRFDVVIIDEASQCDIRGLVALYAGKNAVIVGDDEQVSPSGIGVKTEEISHIISTTLRGIPQSHLYDEKNSIYDIAQVNFHGGAIRLVEHFRCVPSIIQFSNQLCYEGKLRALRDDSSVKTRPFVVAHRVSGVRSGKRKVNHHEALEITALIKSMSECPEYDGKTVGVISLLGDEQAKEIETHLRRHLPEQEFSDRRILCGGPPQFQGDERDIVFLSMVDSPKGDGPLRLQASSEFKKRFNVAASRARDQLWVVHSLDHLTDLKANDLRHLLIRHALEHGSRQEKVRVERELCESPFEKDVYDRLCGAGYDVKCQWEVGAYRIDLVVQGAAGRRVAIECDGDRYHMDRIEEDLDRQRVLERLGWQFIRIRGTEFYRDRDATMDRVMGELDRLAVRPGEVEAQETSGDTDELYHRLTALAREHAAEWREEMGLDLVQLEIAEECEPALPSGGSSDATADDMRSEGRDETESPVSIPSSPGIADDSDEDSAVSEDASSPDPPGAGRSAREKLPDPESALGLVSMERETESPLSPCDEQRRSESTVYPEPEQEDEDRGSSRKRPERATADKLFGRLEEDQPSVAGGSSDSMVADRVDDSDPSPPEVGLDPCAVSDSIAEVSDMARIDAIATRLESERLRGRLSKRLSDEAIIALEPLARTIVDGFEGSTFKAIAHWAKTQDKLKPWYRRFAYDVGRRIMTGEVLTPKQVILSARTLVLAIEDGFRLEDDSALD